MPDPADQARTVRVRDMQTHSDRLDVAAGRMRLALNLAGVSLDEVHRGDELATPGYLRPTTRLDVHLAFLRMPGKELRRTVRGRLHMATSEVAAEVRLLDQPPASPCRGFAQIRVSAPVAAAWGQRFIVRDAGGTRTLGGGRVVRCAARAWTRRRPPDPDGLARLMEGTPAQRVAEAIRGAEWEELPAGQLAAAAGCPDAAAAEALRSELVEAGRVVRLSAGGAQLHLHAELADAAADAVTGRLRRFLDERPRSPGVARGEFDGWMPGSCPRAMRSALAAWMLGTRRLVLAEDFVLPAGHPTAVSGEDAALLEAILAEFHAAAFQPPSLASLRCRTERNAKRVSELVRLAEARGRLVAITSDIRLHHERHAEMIDRVARAIRERGGVTVAEVRTLLGSSRKYVVPLVEHLDKLGVTRREGDLRRLGPNAPGAGPDFDSPVSDGPDSELPGGGSPDAGGQGPAA